MMTCDKRRLIEPAIDGELHLLGHARLRAHLTRCVGCATEFRRQRRLRHLIRQVGARRPRRAVAPQQAPRRSAAWWPTWGGQAIGLAASVALVACLIVTSLPTAEDPGLRRALISSHVRTLLADRLLDLPVSGDRPLAPWLAARVGMTLPVIDLAADGFRLVGARIDSVADHATAVFVYRADDHVINLFVWAEPSDSELTPGAWSAEGYSVCHWRRDDAAFFAVSDLSAEQLDGFETLYKSRHREIQRKLRVGLLG
jgi:anti-sigma factor RsiW